MDCFFFRPVIKSCWLAGHVTLKNGPRSNPWVNSCSICRNMSTHMLMWIPRKTLRFPPLQAKVRKTTIHSSIRSLIHSSVSPSVHAFVRACFRTFVCSFVLSFVSSFVHSSTHQFTHSLRSFVCSFLHFFMRYSVVLLFLLFPSYRGRT